MMQCSLSVEVMRLAKDFDCQDVGLSAERYFLTGVIAPIAPPTLAL